MFAARGLEQKAENRLHLKGNPDSEVEDEGRTIILLRLFVVVIMAALKERIRVPEMSAE